MKQGGGSRVWYSRSQSLVGVMTYLLLSIPAYGDPDTNLHFAAHTGSSFAVDTIAYGVFKQNRFNYPKTLAFLTTLTIGLAYKLQEHTQANQLVTPMAENVLGAAAATLTIYTFDF